MSIKSRTATYNYYVLTNGTYGDKVLPDTPTGSIEIDIEIQSKSVSDKAIYSNAQFIGLTKEEVNDTYVIDFNNDKLKVLYVYPVGKYKQVFLSKWG